MANRTIPSGRRIIQPPSQIEKVDRITWNYLNQLVRDLELNFLDTQQVETATQTIVTSVNNTVVVVQQTVSNVSTALVSNVSVLGARITSVNDRISAVSAALTSVVNNHPFSAIILGDGSGALTTQSGLILRMQDSRDL